MRKLCLLFTTCLMLLLGITSSNQSMNTLTNNNLQHEVKRAAKTLDPYQVSYVPDYLVPGNKTRTTLKDIGLPTSITLPDLDSYRNSESFEITGLCYTRTLSGSTYSQPTLAGLASDCATVETVYLGPVYASDESSESRNNNQDYTQFTSAKTLLIYNYKYLPYVYKFPEVENIVFLTNDFRLVNALPQKLKNVYILPRYNGSSTFWSTTTYLEPSHLTHKINIVCAENDKLLAQKYIDSITKNAAYNQNCVIPDLYYVADNEALIENPSINKTYEFGGMYYLVSTVNSVTYTLFGYVGKYVTKAIFDYSKINTSATLGFTSFSDEIVHADEVYYYANNYTTTPYMQHFYANRLIHMDEYKRFETANYVNFKEVYLHKVTNKYTLVKIDESSTQETSYFLDESVKGLDAYSQIENSEYLEGKIGYYDTRSIMPNLEVTIEGVSVSSLNSIKSYTELVEEAVNQLDNNPFGETPENTNKNLFEVPLIILGTVGGIIIVYALYKIITKSKSWLKD